MTRCIEVTVTAPKEVAQRLARIVVEESLVACAQLSGPVASTYRWQGELETADEWYCRLKTTERRLPALVARIRGLHPYEVPEIIATPIVDGNPDYLAWIEAEVNGGAKEGEAGT